MRWLETGGNPLANLRAMRDLAGDMLDQQTRVVLQLCEDADALLYAVTTMLVVAPIAEKLGIAGGRSLAATLSPNTRLSFTPVSAVAAAPASGRALQQAEP